MARTAINARAAQPEAEAPPALEELGLDEVDAASAASMDASDPPAFGGTTGVGAGGDELRESVARRAYELWHDDGCPEGRALDYWLAAEHELGFAEGGRELTG